MRKTEPTIADRIRAHMKLRRVSVKSMAQACAVTERSWEYWLKDPESRISIGRLKIIAAVLGTTPGELIGG